MSSDDSRERSRVGTGLSSGGRRTMYVRLPTKSHERVYEPQPSRYPALQHHRLMSRGVYGDRKN